MNEILRDSLVVDLFLAELGKYAEVQSQLGNHDRAIIISKAAQVIETLSAHCMDHDIGIPAYQIRRITKGV
jgi:hypothetical protein